MDRFTDYDPGKLNYQAALEFIGEVRAGISWEHFCIEAVRHFDALIGLLEDTVGSVEFLSSRNIAGKYVQDQVREILRRLIFNKENDYYLALGLPHSTSEKEIHKRWKDLMLIYHPDRSNDEESALCATRVNEAYNVLKNREQRAEYDINLSRRGPLFRAGYARHGYKAFRSQSHSAESSRTSRVLPRIVILTFLAVAFFLVLLILFLENRQTAFHSDELLKTAPDKIQVAQAQSKEVVGMEEKEAVQTNVTPEDKLRTRETFPPSHPSRPEKMGRTTEKAVAALPLMKSPDDEQEKERLVEPIASRPSIAESVDDRLPDTQKASPAKVPMTETSAAPRTEASPVDKESYGADWKDDIYLFLLQYANAYEKGDIDAFMALRSRDIIENNSLRYEDIRKYYKTHFEAGKYRYTLRDVVIGRGHEGFLVTGIYRIEKLSGSDKGATTMGRISWTLRNEDGALRLVHADYDSR